MVVPTLGRRIELLRQSLASIRSQEVDADIVVVSPDLPSVRAVVTEFGARFVPDPKRGGQSGALNAGLEAAAQHNKYFAWLCDDDILTPGSLGAAEAALEGDPEASMVYGWCDYIDGQGRVLFSSRAGRLARTILLWGPNLVPQPGSLMRLSDVVEAGGIDESCRLTMDLDLFLRLRQRGRVLCLERTLAQFRWHSDSLTVSQQKASMDEADQVRQRYMGAVGARLYPVLRWPGRWALLLAKRRVNRRAQRTSRTAPGQAPGP
jgi:GT2 family glycosyltransferase